MGVDFVLLADSTSGDEVVDEGRFWYKIILCGQGWGFHVGRR